LQDELQDDGDEHIIFVVLVEQLTENVNETHKSCGGNKPGHKPNVERGRKVNHVEFFVITLQCNLFTMKKISDIVFECVENCFPKWK
jgi:hypothetical protein